MIHVCFNRPTEEFKVFDQKRDLKFNFGASGDAWGDGIHSPYGHDYPIPPGHYLLASIEHMDPPLASEGAAQIDVHDVDSASMAQLVEAGLAIVTVDVATIGEITLPIGELARWGRAAIMIHGGGSNAPDPFAPDQVLCKTEGCTRLHNADLAELVAFLEPQLAAEHVVFSVLGNPVPLAS